VKGLRHHVLQWAETVGQKKLGTWGHGATWASAAPFKTKAAGQISRAERTARDRSCWCAEVSAGMCAQRANACMHRCHAVRTICPARLRASKAVAYLCRVGVLPAHIPGACLLVYVGANACTLMTPHALPYASVDASVYTLKNAILAYTHTHTHTHTQTLSLSLTHNSRRDEIKHTQQSLSLSLSHAHTHTQRKERLRPNLSLTHTHTPHGEIPLLDVPHQPCH
jgi:hypothetical protein